MNTDFTSHHESLLTTNLATPIIIAIMTSCDTNDIIATINTTDKVLAENLFRK